MRVVKGGDGGDGDRSDDDGERRYIFDDRE